MRPEFGCKVCTAEAGVQHFTFTPASHRSAYIAAKMPPMFTRLFCVGVVTENTIKTTELLRACEVCVTSVIYIRLLADHADVNDNPVEFCQQSSVLCGDNFRYIQGFLCCA